jgi:uncharacterized membrane protein/predicted DsbA family dithiol-disulfide isomerase
VRLFAPLVTLLRASYAAALFACGALVIDYQNIASPTFCGPESGCSKVRTSEAGKLIAEKVAGMFGGASLPQVALLLFVALLVYSFFLRSRRELAILTGISAIGGAIALALIVVQAMIHAICPYCMIVDGAALVAAGAAVGLLLGSRSTAERPSPKEAARHESLVGEKLGALMSGDHLIAWGFAGAVVVVTPFVWSHYPENPALPPAIQKLQEPGKTTIVSFTDFQCPHCRGLYPTLKSAEQAPNVSFHRYMAPLDGHPGAMPAAQAYVCSPEDKREALAEALYAADPKVMNPEGIVEIATSVGVQDATALRTCMLDPATKEKILAERSMFFDELGGQGLPTTWVNQTVVVGNKPDLVTKALRGPQVELPVWAMFVVAIATMLGATALSLRKSPAGPRADAGGGGPKARPASDSATEDA